VPLATETLKTLFEDGPSWTSKRRRITEKHNFICGNSSIIKFKVANAWLKWLKGERNIAVMNPTNDTVESAEHVDDTVVAEQWDDTEERDMITIVTPVLDIRRKRRRRRRQY
jgi:hypothetical protein